MNLPEQVTQLLDRLHEGDRSAWNELMPVLYDELRQIAAGQFRGVAECASVHPTMLVHEAWSRLAARDGGPWTDRTHFLAVAAMVMRSVLVDHARKREAGKRGGDWKRVTITRALADHEESATFDLLDLDEALARLEALNARQAEIVTLRFFGGLTMGAIAEALQVSLGTVEADWRLARAWLSVQLRGPSR